MISTKNDLIDLAIGEAHIVRDALSKSFDLNISPKQIGGMWEYTESQGWAPLVKFLEDKHNLPVVITNGAKQGLGACMFAINQLGKKYLGVKNPYWADLVPLAKIHGLELTDKKYDSYLCVMPNNPCGFIRSHEDLKYLADYHKYLSMPFIHDAAYYSHTYLPDDYILNPFGDAQIYSFSKTYGLSSMRLGYVVCNDDKIYEYVKRYVKTMTVGVSTLSQMFMYDLLISIKENPLKEKAFIQESRELLMMAKLLIRSVKSDVIEIPDDIEKIPGMFLFAKTGAKANFSAAKIKVLDGTTFGAAGYVRINLAVPIETLQEAIIRLNSL